ncbi:hypothetical protein DL764_005957 [Monosporascus ibericus]|uniref:Uncharacterized protein n=1 Tax=Monosporascus ibericus TaxID=155417 RepID=A0A4Q4TAN2_9PEZI|nr:hypothetical protein DL764_005957 [Monosporascus ibericus]
MFGEPNPQEPEASEAGSPDPKMLLCEVGGKNERVKFLDGTITKCRQCQNANKACNACLKKAAGWNDPARRGAPPANAAGPKLCIECGVNERVKYPSGTKTRCRECYSACTTRTKRLRRAARVASGQCEVTGCHRLSDPGVLSCSIHRQKQSKAGKSSVRLKGQPGSLRSRSGDAQHRSRTTSVHAMGTTRPRLV